MVGLRVGFATEHHYPAKDIAAVIERPGDIHTQLTPIIRAITQLHFTLRRRSRVLAHQVHQTARRIFAVE